MFRIKYYKSELQGVEKFIFLLKWSGVIRVNIPEQIFVIQLYGNYHEHSILPTLYSIPKTDEVF